MIILECRSLLQEDGEFFGRRYALLEAIQQSWDADLIRRPNVSGSAIEATGVCE